IPPYRVALIAGIACSAKTPHYIDTYGLHALHGRALPVATGAKLANNQLTVVAVGGDGDGYGIGAGYFVNSGRRNVDMTYIVFNNGVYGLTKGQASPTLAKGLKTKSMPEASIQEGVNPIALALGAGYTLIGRASYETGDSLAVGVFYSIALPTYDEQLAVKVPALKDHPLVDLPLYQRDVGPLFAELA